MSLPFQDAFFWEHSSSGTARVYSRAQGNRKLYIAGHFNYLENGNKLALGGFTFAVFLKLPLSSLSSSETSEISQELR